MLKQSLLTARVDYVIRDNKMKPQEGELLRIIALALDCPMPPLVSASNL